MRSSDIPTECVLVELLRYPLSLLLLSLYAVSASLGPRFGKRLHEILFIYIAAQIYPLWKLVALTEAALQGQPKHLIVGAAAVDDAYLATCQEPKHPKYIYSAYV